MPFTIYDFQDVEDRARKLGCAPPTRLAILPRNFETANSKDELMHESTAATVRTLLRAAGLSETPIEPEGERFRFVQENAFTWVGPILFFAAAQLLQDPRIVSVSLGVIANYLTDFFRGISGKRRVTFDIVVEQTRTKRHVRLHYDGDVDGFAQIPDAVLELIHYERTPSPVSGQDE